MTPEKFDTPDNLTPDKCREHLKTTISRKRKELPEMCWLKAEQSDFQEIFRRRPEGSPPRSRGPEVPKTSDCNNNIEVAGEVKGKQRPGGQSEEDASIQLGR